MQSESASSQELAFCQAGRETVQQDRKESCFRQPKSGVRRTTEQSDLNRMPFCQTGELQAETVLILRLQLKKYLIFARVTFDIRGSYSFYFGFFGVFLFFFQVFSSLFVFFRVYWEIFGIFRLFRYFLVFCKFFGFYEVFFRVYSGVFGLLGGFRVFLVFFGWFFNTSLSIFLRPFGSSIWNGRVFIGVLLAAELLPVFCRNPGRLH